ncbi:unnamed protein product [Gadus morhua 'NCC']
MVVWLPECQDHSAATTAPRPQRRDHSAATSAPRPPLLLLQVILDPLGQPGAPIRPWPRAPTRRRPLGDTPGDTPGPYKPQTPKETSRETLRAPTSPRPLGDTPGDTPGPYKPQIPRRHPGPP